MSPVRPPVWTSRAGGECAGVANVKKPLNPIGWREWLQLPDLGVDWLKAKVDTGARSSSLHALDVEEFERDGERWVRFAIHPQQRSAATTVTAEAPLLESRAVKSSNGTSEVRPVIQTRVRLGGVERLIEVTLTRRDDMGFRMLLGREALRGAFAVEPDRSFVTGRPPAAGARDPIVVGGTGVSAGKRQEVALPISRLPSGTQVTLPVIVVHGRAEGPTVWLSAAIHGDEINGVEIIRRVLEKISPKTLRGTILAVPTVNVHGFASGDRYLPDRRDLNRSFPGSARGSLARRIAHLFMDEVVRRCAVGIDLHTGSDGRANLPQLRADLEDAETRRLASAFGCPLMLHAEPREGTLRHAATKAGARVLLFEGGEAHRFGRPAIEAGAAGVLRVLAALDLIDPVVPAAHTLHRGGESKWVRARTSGLAQIECDLGDLVEDGQPLGCINDTMGARLSGLKSPCAGMVIGLRLEPLVNRGDGLVHVAITHPEGPV